MDPDTVEILRQGLIVYLILASSIAIHEWAHAIAADRLGDDLPRLQGRVTLNPLAHLDPIGTGLIPLFNIFSPLVSGQGFFMLGWGKPVQVDINHFRRRPGQHMIVVAAGPFSNAIIALGAAFLGGILTRVGININPLVYSIITINCALIVFNLIPIPPLDGSHFLRYLTGMSEESFYRLSMYGLIIMLVLINLSPFRILIGTAVEYLRFPFLVILLLVGG